jgi:hypothetical protein
LARSQARRQRRERYAGAALALLGVVVLVIAIIALREPNGHVNSAASDETTAAAKDDRQSQQAPQSTPANTHATSPSDSNSAPASGAAKSVPLVVYNDTTTQGLAHDAAQRFESGGWTVSRFANIPSGISDIISTCAYYDPSDPAAKSAAEALQQQFPTIKRTKPKFAGLGDGPVVVVLTPDYSAS